MTVADRIKYLREKKEMSQEELAHRMGLKSRSSITRIEKSGNDISLRDVERLSEIFNVSPLYLMGWDSEIGDKQGQYTKELPDHLKRYAEFIDLYSQLGEDEQDLVDNMISTLLKKQ